MGESKDREFLISLIESINDHLVNVMRSMGAKVKVKQKQNAPMEEGRNLNEVLTEISNKGSVVKVNKKHGTL